MILDHGASVTDTQLQIAKDAAQVILRAIDEHDKVTMIPESLGGHETCLECFQHLFFVLLCSVWFIIVTSQSSADQIAPVFPDNYHVAWVFWLFHHQRLFPINLIAENTQRPHPTSMLLSSLKTTMGSLCQHVFLSEFRDAFIVDLFQLCWHCSATSIWFKGQILGFSPLQIPFKFDRLMTSDVCF